MNNRTESDISLLRLLLTQACLRATNWWVFREEHYHFIFNLLGNKAQLENELVQDVFYNFTQYYSLLRGTKGDRRVIAMKTLRQLLNAGFYDYVVEDGAPSFDIDKQLFLECTPQEKPQRSLLSKFATLIQPEKYSMLDSFAVDSLYKLSAHSVFPGTFTKSKLNKDYTYFMEAFTAFKNEILTKDLIGIISVHHAYLLDNFQKDISLEAYQNRVLDKLLLGYYQFGKGMIGKF